MPYKPHIRVTALGRLGVNTAERFSYGFAMDAGPGAIPGLSANQAVWEDVAADIRLFHTSAAMRLSFRAVLTEVKFASIGADGKYTADPIVVPILDGGGNITVTPSEVTPQAALAVSLTTEARGAKGRGRFYVPMPCVPIGDDLLMPEGTRDAIQASAATLIQNIGNQPGVDVLDLQVVVASTSGVNNAVTGVRVGRVVDTVRSRRRSLPESYDPATVVQQGSGEP